MKTTILLGIIAVLVLIAGCDDNDDFNPQSELGQSYCHENSCDTAVIEVQDLETQCRIKGIACTDAKVTGDNIRLTLKNDLGRDMIIHSIVFNSISCSLIADEKIFRETKETFVVPCSLNQGNLLYSQFTVKYTAGDGMIKRPGEIYAVVEK